MKIRDQSRLMATIHPRVESPSAQIRNSSRWLWKWIDLHQRLQLKHPVAASMTRENRRRCWAWMDAPVKNANNSNNINQLSLGNNESANHCISASGIPVSSRSSIQPLAIHLIWPIWLHLQVFFTCALINIFWLGLLPSCKFTCKTTTASKSAEMAELIHRQPWKRPLPQPLLNWV